MPDYFNWLFAQMQARNIDSVLLSMHGVSRSFFFWFLVALVVRYHLPSFVLWAIHIVRPQAFDSPKNTGYRPLISVLIAGRNPGKDIAKTIQSVLSSGYENVEIIYSDDFSTDDSVAWARQFERTGKVRVFASERHNGKPTNLNIALMMARGELLFVLDSDCEIDRGAIDHLVAYFQDARIGAVACNIVIRNASDNIITRLTGIEYALNSTLPRMWRSPLNMLNIMPGAATMFRATAMRRIGGYDTGLGDDTDVTVRLRKAGWLLRFAVRSNVWTDTPRTLKGLIRQRNRWARNMVKIRFRKHLDAGLLRYGLTNMVVWWDFIIFRVGITFLGLYALLFSTLFKDIGRPEIIVAVYWATILLVLSKALIANDITGLPRLRNCLLIFLYPLYRLPVRLGECVSIIREVLHIKTYHPYVPKRIWRQIPHH